MSEYDNIKKLDEESLQHLTEGKGPADECICSLLSPPGGRRSFAASVKKAFAAFTGKKNQIGRKEVDVPLTFSKDGAGIYSTKEVVKRKKSCGKCGCDKDTIVMRHSFANIRISSPDVSSICPCPTDCLPDKEKIKNNIKVIVEHSQVELNSPYISEKKDLNK